MRYMFTANMKNVKLCRKNKIKDNREQYKHDKDKINVVGKHTS